MNIDGATLTVAYFVIVLLVFGFGYALVRDDTIDAGYVWVFAVGWIVVLPAAIGYVLGRAVLRLATARGWRQ